MTFLRLHLTRFVYLSVLILIGSNGYALTLNERAQKISTSFELREEFLQDFQLEIEKNVKVIRRPIKLYHYANFGALRYPRGVHEKGANPTQLKVFDDEAMVYPMASSKTPVPLSNSQAEYYFRQMADNSAKINQQDWMVGLGLYAGVDPVQSEVYAGSPWVMLELSVPANTRYLELRPWNALILSKVFIDRWLSRATEEFSRMEQVQGRDYYRIPWNSIIRNDAFRNLVSDGFRRSSIQMIAYTWGRYKHVICRDRSNDESIAFNFINSGFLDQGLKIKTFVQNLEPTASEQKKAEYARIFDKIDSATILVYHDQYHPSTAGRMRLLSLPWTRVLNRKSIFSQFVFSSDQEALALADYYAFSEGPSSQKEPTWHLNSGIVNDELTMDPMIYLQQVNPVEAEKRLKQIGEDTFGCSPDPRFADENEHARYPKP